jgi:hypothetical protein
MDSYILEAAQQVPIGGRESATLTWYWILTPFCLVLGLGKRNTLSGPGRKQHPTTSLPAPGEHSYYQDIY